MKHIKPKITLKVHNWNHGTKAEQDECLFLLIGLIADLSTTYREEGLDDGFTAIY